MGRPARRLLNARVLALSDATLNFFGVVFVAIVGLVGTVLTLLFRSTKQEATAAARGVDDLSRQFGQLEERHRGCQRDVRKLYKGLAQLQRNAGLPVTPPPDTYFDDNGA